METDLRGVVGYLTKRKNSLSWKSGGVLNKVSHILDNFRDIFVNYNLRSCHMTTHLVASKVISSLPFPVFISKILFG